MERILTQTIGNVFGEQFVVNVKAACQGTPQRGVPTTLNNSVFPQQSVKGIIPIQGNSVFAFAAVLSNLTV